MLSKCPALAVVTETYVQTSHAGVRSVLAQCSSLSLPQAVLSCKGLPTKKAPKEGLLALARQQKGTGPKKCCGLRNHPG
eukprot:6151318-Amphidinium_carterae.1